MMSITIDVGTKFSRSPLGRYYSDGNSNGTRFREEVLKPELIKSDESITLDFSNVSIGVGSSFLEEAFGGLVRDGFDADELKRRIKIVGGMAAYPSQFERFVERARTQLLATKG
ncbi:STAS-like domain-containing protein [Aeromonas caviae]|uniref:STAS-like domain-containing protein n=1 Tax=Aeromonas caviae TaxID=648 RepID=UPI00227FA975|nr:STAS-like domain-containing protein [Aeromonas caviae]MCY9815177.1 STAS-like domain-containing protein [Aeromonas caviae]